jgi:ribosomal protein S6
MEIKPQEADQAQNLYEIGYLLSPFIAADQLAGELDKTFKITIEALGGKITSQLAPVMRPLAYSVSKSVGSKRTAYKDAYFGALRFELDAENALKLQQALDKTETLIRFLTIRLPKNADRTINFSHRKAVSATTSVTTARKDLGQAIVEKEEEVKTPVNEVELDKEIEGLLVETKAE